MSSSRTKHRRESKSSSSSSSSKSQWSEWQWVAAYNCYGHCRKNSKFNDGYEWEYHQPEQTTTEEAVNQQGASNVPRYQPDTRDQLTAADRASHSPESEGGVPVDNVPNVPFYEAPGSGRSQTSYSQSNSYTYKAADGMGALTRGFEATNLSEGSRGTHNKGKQPASSWQPAASSASHSQRYSSQSGQGTVAQTPQTYQSQDYYPGQNTLGYIEEDEQATDVEPFRNQYPQGYQNPYNTFAATPYSGNPYGQGQGSYGYGQGSTNPSTDPDVIGGDNAEREELYPEYKVHYSKEFKAMRVFKMVWHETRGENNTFGTDTVRGAYGQAVNASIRRFIIVKADKGHCLCLPILTYNQQGTKKHGLIAQHHGQIYTGRHPPDLLTGEEPLEKEAIRMEPRGSERLHKASRINYAKVYTVEHNVKCVFIGKIAGDDHKTIIEEYNKTLQLRSS